MLELLLAGATILGGFSAAWFFWDKWRARKPSDQPPLPPFEQPLVPFSCDVATAEGLSSLARMAYVLLRLDQLPDTGNWGFTINRYIELNYPHDPDILARKNSYLREGSITHTAHALRGLAFLRTALPRVEPDLIRRWIDSNSTEVGFVVPRLPANPDETRGLAKEIRHTTTSTLCLYRLAAHMVHQGGATETRRLAEAQANLLLGFSGVWVHDPRMTYSHAYLLELFHLMRSDHAFARVRPALDRQIQHGLAQLFERISIASPFWCADTHPETKMFYTLLILVRLVALPETYLDSSHTDKLCATLQEIGRHARALGGVPLGGREQDGRFGVPDLGVTTAFLECCCAAGSRLPLRDLTTLAVHLVDRCATESATTAANAITHSWEGVLSLLATTSTATLIDVPAFASAVEPHLQEVRDTLRRPVRLPLEALRELARLVGREPELVLRFESDIWNSARLRAQLDHAGSG